MPATYTHYLVAKNTLQRLPETRRSRISLFLPLYFFGAQGADFCFFYHSFTPKTPNFGSYLHRKGGFDAFSVLRLFSMNSSLIKAYALGFITHYATDFTFHPYVYSVSGKSPVTHNRLEYALDLYFKSNEKNNDEYAQYQKTALNETQKKELFYAYGAIAAKCGFPTLSYNSFLRAISLFNAYPPISSTLFKRKDTAFLQVAANEEKSPWTPPAEPNVIRKESAKELLELSVLKSVNLIDSFLFSVENKTPLPKKSFSKSFLTGL